MYGTLGALEKMWDIKVKNNNTNKQMYSMTCLKLSSN